MRAPLLVGAACVLSGLAGAQSFNVDLGSNLILFPEPDSSYGGAANQPGVWTPVEYPYQNVALYDLQGALTGVTLNDDSGEAGGYANFMTQLAGDDEKLMEDQLWVPNLNAVVTLTFTGLANGNYDVITYGWDESGATTLIDVPLGTGGEQTVGGFWAGSPHVAGVTYSSHSVTVFDGTLSIEARGPAQNDSGGLNGVQITLGDGGLGTNYCVGAINSTGFGAEMSAAGSNSVAINQLALSAGPVPDQPGLFFFGQTQVQIPFGNGFRCTGGTLVRLPIIPATNNSLNYSVDNTTQPSSAWIQPGATLDFQAWYRDPAGGGSSFNLSDGLELTFTP